MSEIVKKITIRVFKEGEVCGEEDSLCAGLCMWRNGYWLCGRDIEDELKKIRGGSTNVEKDKKNFRASS